MTGSLRGNQARWGAIALLQTTRRVTRLFHGGQHGHSPNDGSRLHPLRTTTAAMAVASLKGF